MRSRLYRRRLTGLAALGVVSLMAGAVAGQAPTVPPNQTSPEAHAATEPPRTPYGRPDLQGTWTFANLTPLQRPSQFTGREVLTAKEAVEYEAFLKERGNRGKEIELAYDARIWRDRGGMSTRTSLIVDPPDGRMPPMTPDGQERAAAAHGLYTSRRLAAAGPEDRTLGERCLLGRPAGPPMRPETYNNTVQVFQTPDYVVLLPEMIHNARIIPLDGRPRVGVDQYVGESRGHWEDDTLVVETINFRSDAAAFVIRGASDSLRVIERFSRADADTLAYEFTIDDVATWDRPWTAQFPMTKAAGMWEFACHEGNYGMFNILSAARAADKAAEGASTE